jgi:aryl-alcohol dehydrogenase-like predicted oxidoreductase
MTALAAGWVLSQGAQPIIGARTPAEARQLAEFRPLPPGLAAAAQAAADAAFASAGHPGPARSQGGPVEPRTHSRGGWTVRRR